MTEKEKKYLEYLNSKFDELKFIEFVQDLLNLEQKDFILEDVNVVQETFKDYIKRYKKVASYTIGIEKIGVFIIEINESTVNKERVSRARVKQRNYVATLLDSYNLEAAIVAFYSNDEDAWRISFVKRELELTDKGIKQNVSPARRYSYLVGANESIHTAKEYLFNLLKNNEKKFSVSEIEEQFNVEKVTEQFFAEYKEKYLQLKEYLDNNIDFQTEAKRCDFKSEEFAKKLLGQIVFLYFLQKKGWLGVQLIPEELEMYEFDELIIQYKDDIISQNLLKNYYKEVDHKYHIEIEKFRLNEMNENIFGLINIFKNTKYDMPWGTGNKNFIRSIFEKAESEHKNFFDDYLEPFFYTGLNQKREKQSQFFPLFNCKIPFLNGGLFEELNGYRWSIAHFDLPNKMFSNGKDGILDFLDTYNFTIDEEEPLEKDIAVDPEMLGKIFENLLEIKDRKSKGAFYTPRNIVYYMCQEAIANYLVNKVGVDYNETLQFIKYGDMISQYDWELFNNECYEFEIGESLYNNIISLDEALIKVKIADPAVGSGAFPLGMLTEIVKLRNNLQTYLLIQNELKIINIENIYNTEHTITDPYLLKLQTIENCIYAVDIEPSAVDIAKLRLWLSLIVDYPNNKEPQPLPNLDCKIMQGNSLVDRFEGIKLFSNDIFKATTKKDISKEKIQMNLLNNPIYVKQSFAFDGTDTLEEDLFGELQKYQKQFFINSNSDEKKYLKSKIEAIQFKLIEKSFEKYPNKLLKLKEEEQKRKKSWFIWELDFFDVFKNNQGFDIVIGNPPYVSTKGAEAEDKKNLTDIYGFYDDLYNHFIFKSIDLLKDNGILSMITSNTYFTTYTKKGLRKKILENQLIKIVDLGYNVFKSAMVSTAIIELKKNSNNKTFKTKVIDVKNSFSIDTSPIYEINQKIFNNSINEAFFIPTNQNLKINNLIGEIHNNLLDNYWKYISTSKNITKYNEILEEYRDKLKEKDWTLVGLVCDGGQGLATGNNGKYLGIIDGTSEAKRIKKLRESKLQEFNKDYNKNFIMPSDEKEVWKLFDSLKEEYGRDIFGQGFVFKIVDKSLLADLDSLTEEEKENGICGEKVFVPYDKGDKEGNRWFFDNPFVICWDKKYVSELKENAGKKGPGGSRYQNSQFYFREGFCYMDVHTRYLKARKKGVSIHDVMGMSFFPLTDAIPFYYLVCLINSKFIADFVFNFLNNTSHFQINDCRMLPIPVPSENQLEKFKHIYEAAESIQKQYFDNILSKEEKEEKLNKIQATLDDYVNILYNIS